MNGRKQYDGWVNAEFANSSLHVVVYEEAIQYRHALIEGLGRYHSSYRISPGSGFMDGFR